MTGTGAQNLLPDVSEREKLNFLIFREEAKSS